MIKWETLISWNRFENAYNTCEGLLCIMMLVMFILFLIMEYILEAYLISIFILVLLKAVHDFIIKIKNIWEDLYY